MLWRYLQGIVGRKLGRVAYFGSHDIEEFKYARNPAMSAVQGIKQELRTNVKYLFGPRHTPGTLFLIFGPGRSGSTLLGSLLNSHPQIMCEGEILAHRVLWPARYVRARAALSAAEVYGFKLLSYQLTDVQAIRSPADFLRRLQTQGYQLIYLRRTNLFRHAISNLYARHRQAFHHRAGDGQLRLEPMVVDVRALHRWMQGRAQMEQIEQALLASIPHLPLTYEQNLLDESSQQDAVDQIVTYLGVATAPVETDLVKVTNRGSLTKIIANYEEVLSFVADTPFSQYVENEVVL